MPSPGLGLLPDKIQEVCCIRYLLAEKNVLLSKVKTTRAEDLIDGKLKKLLKVRFNEFRHLYLLLCFFYTDNMRGLLFWSVFIHLTMSYT